VQSTSTQILPYVAVNQAFVDRTGERSRRTVIGRTAEDLFEPLLAGADVLTNMHANTTIPEILGAARAWEVTGDDRWRAIVEAYWRQAVTARGYFATGGQTCGEIWTPPHEQAARLGDKNQEHCTVYNMMLLADRLLRAGVPFRSAHRRVGELVALAEARSCDLSDLSLAELRQALPELAGQANPMPTLDEAVAAADVHGGTAPHRVRAALSATAQRLAAR